MQLTLEQKNHITFAFSSHIYVLAITNAYFQGYPGFTEFQA